MPPPPPQNPPLCQSTKYEWVSVGGYYVKKRRPCAPATATVFAIGGEQEEAFELPVNGPRRVHSGGSGCVAFAAGVVLCCVAVPFLGVKDWRGELVKKPPAVQAAAGAAVAGLHKFKGGGADDWFLEPVKSIADFKAALRASGAELVVRIGPKNMEAAEVCRELGVRFECRTAIEQAEAEEVAKEGAVLFHQARK